MDPFLDLDQDLDLSSFEYRRLIEGRAAINDAIAQLTAGENGETRDVAQLSDEDGQRLDGLLTRGEDVHAEIERRDAERNVERRSERISEFARSASRATPPARPAPNRRSSGRREERDPVEHPDSQRYSLLRCIDLLARNKPIDGYEAEISQEIAKRTGKEPQGFFVPWTLGLRSDQPYERREFDGFDTTQGAGMIPTILSSRFLDVLRNQMVMTQLGAGMMTDLVGKLSVPKKTDASTAYWVGEGEDVTESTMVVETIDYEPRTLGAFTTVTRAMRSQGGSATVEQRIRQDLLDTVRIELDRVGIDGSGSDPEPEGILQVVTPIAIDTDGGPLTWARVVELEAAVDTRNALAANCAYLTSPRGRGHLKTLRKDAGSGIMVWNGTNLVNGYKAVASNQVPSDLTKGSGDNLTALIFGDFAACSYALWTGFDVLVDPYSGATSGNTRVVVLIDADFQVEREESFAAFADVDPGFEDWILS